MTAETTNNTPTAWQILTPEAALDALETTAEGPDSAAPASRFLIVLTGVALFAMNLKSSGARVYPWD